MFGSELNLKISLFKGLLICVTIKYNPQPWLNGNLC